MNAELFGLLAELGRAGFDMDNYVLDRPGHPTVVAGVLNHHDGDCADVIILYAEGLAYAFRAPVGDSRDVLAPAEVFWDCPGKAVRAIRAVLALPTPSAEDAPRALYPPKPQLCLPAAVRVQSPRGAR